MFNDAYSVMKAWQGIIFETIVVVDWQSGCGKEHGLVAYC
jgi:hypothetical protein